MTGDNQIEPLFESLSCDDNTRQQQQEPYHVVLVDIQRAIRYKEIHCVKKPLEGDLKFVAISYRWGELDETVINTGVGYTATIKSFHLGDFYKLCWAIRKEVDLKDMDYVWIDALCINQADERQRTNTIHHMSAIYEHANYILAVPDLHKAHLEKVSTLNMNVMAGSYIYQNYIYHLIHGNTYELARIESQWLDKLNVPRDPVLRELLTTFTDHFMDGFMKYRKHYEYYNSVEVLNHILEKSPAATTYPEGSDYYNIKEYYDLTDDMERLRLHSCNQEDCPLHLFDRDLSLPRLRLRLSYLTRNDKQKWPQQIYERSATIRQSMKLMADLIKDWSSRVWVISEYNIARKKNNMKYYFTQLNGDVTDIKCGDHKFTFFKFDFDRPAYIAAAVKNDLSTATLNDYTGELSSDPVYLIFHKIMLIQLNEQTIFEMLLKSKATKHVDRFYAILPATEYKNKIALMGGDSWKMDSLVSVKLKLFEWMNTKDKLELLFLSGCNPLAALSFPIVALPSFATTTINWDVSREFFPLLDEASSYNFDLTSSSSAIMLGRNNDNGMPYLNLKPKRYYVNYVDYVTVQYDKFSTSWFLRKKLHLWDHLQPENPDSNNVLVWIPDQTDADIGSDRFDECSICLNGNFEQNMWVLVDISHNQIFGCEDHTIDDHSIGFDIY